MSIEIKRQTSSSVIRNVFYGSLTWLLPLGLSFAATPIIVRSLGNSDYGIYALVLGFIGYSFSFNLGRPITKYIAEFRVTGESQRIREVISASLFLNIVFGVLAVVVICSLAPWLVRSVFKIEQDSQDKTIWALYLASAIIFLSMLNQILSSVIQGVQRFDIYSKVTTASSFALIGGNLVLAYLGYGLLVLLAWNLAVLGIFCVVLGVAAGRLLPEFTLRLKFSGETLRMVLSFSTATIFYQIFANVLFLFERGWITQRLGTDDLTHYVVPMALAMQLQAFISSLVLVVFPLASELKNEKEKLLGLYLKATKAVLFIVAFIVGSVIVQSGIFLSLWMGEDFSRQSSLLLILHIVCFGMISVMSISWQMTEGLGQPIFNTIATALSTTIGVTLMILLIGNYGNPGIALARMTAFAVIFLSVFYIERWFFKHVQVRFWLNLGAFLAIATALAALVEYGINLALSPSWPAFLLSVVCGGAVYCFVLWLLGFVTADEKMLAKRLLSRQGV